MVCMQLGVKKFFLPAIMVTIILEVRNTSIWINSTNDSKSRMNENAINEKEKDYGSINWQMLYSLYFDQTIV